MLSSHDIFAMFFTISFIRYVFVLFSRTLYKAPFRIKITETDGRIWYQKVLWMEAPFRIKTTETDDRIWYQKVL